MKSANGARAWMISGGVALIIMAISVLQASLAGAQSLSGQTRGIVAPGTPTSVGYRAGLVLWDLGETTVTPLDELESDVNEKVFWNDVQVDLAQPPDWRAPSRRVAYIASQGRKTWLSFSFFEDSFKVPATATDYVRAPVDVPRVTYGSGDCQDVAPNYSDPAFQKAYDSVVVSFLSRFGDDPEVAGFLPHLGSSGETINVISNTYGGTCTHMQADFEVTVSCQAYRAWVEHALLTWREHTSKPIYVQMHEAACEYLGTFASARWLLEYGWRPTATPGPSPEGPPGTPTPTPLYIGYLSHALDHDVWDAYGLGSAGRVGWGKMEIGTRMSGQGGSAYMTGLRITAYDPSLRNGMADAQTYAALASGAHNLFMIEDEVPYIHPDALYALTRTIGTTAQDSPAAWVVLRASGFQYIGDAQYGSTGIPGPYSHLLTVTGATPTPACALAVRQTAVAAGGTMTPAAPAICAVAVTAAPTAANSFQYYSYPPNQTVKFEVASEWAHAGHQETFKVAIDYLDTGTTPFFLDWWDGSGVRTDKIERAGGGGWRTASLTLMGSQFARKVAGADFAIRTGASDLQLHRVFVDSVGPPPKPAMTDTPASPTTQPASVAGAPTQQAKGTAWPVQKCPALTLTPDGSLAEWASVTPVVLTYWLATSVQPNPRVDPTREGSAILYCAHDSSALLFAGVVTNSVRLESVDTLERGDSVQLTIDPSGDGSSSPGSGDHRLTIFPDGRIVQGASEPISATVAVTPTASGWQFEVAVPFDALGVADVNSGRVVGLTWALVERDAWDVWPQVLKLGTRAGTLALPEVTSAGLPLALVSRVIERIRLVISLRVVAGPPSDRPRLRTPA